MKIAFFSPSAELKNGWGVVTAEVCQALVEHCSDEVEVDLYLPKVEEGKGYVEKMSFAKNTYFTLPEFVWSFRNPLKLFSYLTTNSLKNKPDIIHVLDFPYALSAMKNAGGETPYIITLCGTFYKPLYNFPDKIFFNKVYKNSANINAISDYTMERATKDFLLPENKTTVIHAGVNYDRFSVSRSTETLKQKYGADKKVVLGVGALKDRKGFDVVIKAMEKVVKEVPNAIYIIVGFGTDKDYLESLVKEKKLERSVFFESGISDQDLPSYFHFADVYSHAPRAINGAFAGFEMVYLEAGAAGKPVVGTNSGGTPSAVVDGKTGYLVKEDDVGAVADRLVKILKDPDLAKRLGDKNREYAKAHDWKNIAGQYVELYREMMKTKNIKTK